MERFLGDRKITLYASGTAALAAAIAQCAASRTTGDPEAILPAYGCPDLVAACLKAGVYPRLVDVVPDHGSYDLAQLEANLGPNTVAIVAVNLLGLGDDSAKLLPLCKAQGILLIQDSAQYLPREPNEWPGNYVVLSFGRGKPLNLLRGGALVEPPGSNPPPQDLPASLTWKNRLLGSRAAGLAFNILTRPEVYGILSALPGTGLGDVSYKPLHEVTLLPEDTWKQVGVAFELYRKKPSYRREIWTPVMEEWTSLGMRELGSPGTPPSAEPLRLALLAPDRPSRNQIVDSLNNRGLGASRFYGSDLPRVAEIPEIVRHQGPFPGARALGDRLFTLPTHRLVTARSVRSALTVTRTDLLSNRWASRGNRT